MEFLALKYQLFIPAKAIVQQIWNCVDFILIIVPILQNFYIFLAIIILELKLDKILIYLSVSDSKIIIAKNLIKFWRIAIIIRIKSTEFQIFPAIALAGIKN